MTTLIEICKIYMIDITHSNNKILRNISSQLRVSTNDRDIPLNKRTHMYELQLG